MDTPHRLRRYNHRLVELVRRTGGGEDRQDGEEPRTAVRGLRVAEEAKGRERPE